jgi:AcrR family transcriptional regulator
MPENQPAARGRHAPPPEVRLPRQRERLLRAAAAVFAERGYTHASSEAISRRAGMSKATFYEHFANKEECILALFDHAVEIVLKAQARAASEARQRGAIERMRAGTLTFLTALGEYPEYAQTLLVEIIGAGPRAAQRRDQVMQRFADALLTENSAAAARGLIGRFASPLDAYAIVGAVSELASRQLRLGEPAEVIELAPVIDRLILGMLSQAAERE